MPHRPARAALPALLLCAAAAAAPSPSGVWLTGDGHGVIVVEPCGDALCGRIAGIDRAPGEPMPHDAQGRPQCGLTILTDERTTGDGIWLGRITDPRDGRNYGAKLWLDADGALHVRGFLAVPLLGATQVWHKFTGRLGPDCTILSSGTATHR